MVNKKIDTYLIKLFKTREYKKLRRKKRKSRQDSHIYLKNENEFLRFLNKSLFVPSKKIRITPNKMLSIKIPKIFSLIRNPDEAIELYRKIYKAFKDPTIKGLTIDYRDCIDMDIAASVIMDVLIMNLDNFKTRKYGNFTCQGDLPRDPKLRKAILSSGIIKQLDFPDRDEKIAEIPGQIACLELINGGQNTDTYKVDTSMTSDIVATRVADYFEECFNIEGLSINDDGKAYICSLVGETINNCQLHSGDFKQFFTLGHYYSSDDNEYGECQLAIFNFGQTMYEGLKFNSKALTTIQDLEKLTSHHKNTFLRNVWDEEILWSLYALQDGVSREKTLDDPDRGTGTVALIKSFQEVGGNSKGNKPEMSIISGNAFIHFDGTYKIQSDISDREIIAFNKQNDLYIQPDKKYVKKLENYFPGTVISLNFYIDKSYIIKLTEENNARV